VRCKVSRRVSDRNSADAKIPWRGERSSCEMFEMKIPFARSAMMIRFFNT